MQKSKIYLKQGFTLIEVLVVLVILGFIVAMAAQVFMKDDDQKRFDETRLRMAEIKKTILGSSGSYTNGQRQFAGYAADMGGLPNLVDENGVADPNGQPKGLWTRDFNADGDTIDFVDIPDSVIWGYRAISRTWMGWRGPYIEVPPLRTGEVPGQEKLNDGWGNPFRFTRGGGDITIESYGADNINDVGGETGYDVDIEITIREAEYMAPLAGRVKLPSVLPGYTSPVTVSLYVPLNGVETLLNPTPDAISGDQFDADQYFRFETGAVGTGLYNGNIPVGLRSIFISDSTPVPNTKTAQRIITIEPTGNWLGDIEIQ